MKNKWKKVARKIEDESIDRKGAIEEKTYKGRQTGKQKEGRKKERKINQSTKEICVKNIRKEWDKRLKKEWYRSM